VDAQPFRVPLRRTAAEQDEEDRFQALYGAWSPLTPTEIARELAGFSRPWWVVGGWAIEAASPWIVDIPLTPDRDGLWTNKRIPRQVAPVEAVTWVDTDGIRYLRPEIVLAYKARLRRPKDNPDFEATLPVLSAEQRQWLQEALTEIAPDHPWVERL
jgi:hypothetical protein